MSSKIEQGLTVTEAVTKTGIGFFGAAWASMTPDKWGALFASAATGIYMLAATYKILFGKRKKTHDDR